MDEYIKREDAIKMVENDLPEVVYYRKQDAIACLECLPTADVVPKSEVVNILDKLMKEAREISDRYKKSANETSDYDYARIEYKGCQMGALLVLFKIAELKKKYEEGKR